MDIIMMFVQVSSFGMVLGAGLVAMLAVVGYSIRAIIHIFKEGVTK